MVRKRNQPSSSKSKPQKVKTVSSNSWDTGASDGEEVDLPWREIGGRIWFLLGALACVCVACGHTWYMNQIHENRLWFSNIKVRL